MFRWFSSCFLIVRQLFIDFSAVVFCWFCSFFSSAVVFCRLCSCFLPARQVFESLAVVFCLFGSCFVLPDAHSRSIFNCPTAQLFVSCILTFWRLCFAGSAVAFLSFGSYFLTYWQLCFDLSAVVF